MVQQNGEAFRIPQTMKAIRYNKVQDWALVDLPVPEPKAHEVLVKLKSCGICGTDLEIHNGNFDSRMPVVTGHESSGIVVKIGSSVQGFKIGDKVTADNSELCGHCHYCRQGKPLYCENFLAHGVHLNGGFAEFCAYPAEKLFHFEKLSWEEAAMFEAASCAVHGLDRIRPEPGVSILVMGAGATGLCLAQLLKQNGGAHLILASNEGPKLDLAKNLNVADEYIPLRRGNEAEQAAQWSDLKNRYPYGFDIVVEATGVHKLLETAFGLVTRGGKLVYYGVYPKDAVVKVVPSKFERSSERGAKLTRQGRVFGDEITIIGSFSEMYCLPRAVHYLETRKVDVRGIVTHTFKLEQFGEALDAVRNKTCIKAAIVYD
ncbi:chaperonin 10-like protein [Phyllosticta citriasiana]|uniref:chaperonin 10-like protein n=1 Tax=Phyllosticta citriasiana TaxID=595635 RepID=UPI0030FDDBAE